MDGGLILYLVVFMLFIFNGARFLEFIRSSYINMFKCPITVQQMMVNGYLAKYIFLNFTDYYHSGLK